MNSSCIISVHVVLAQEWNYTQTVENGTTVTIVCNLAATLPGWTGPPTTDSVVKLHYNYQNSTTFNPALGQEKLSRLGWAANNRDLTLSPVTRDDAGTYQCYNKTQRWNVSLLVRGMLHDCDRGNRMTSMTWQCACRSFVHRLILKVFYNDLKVLDNRR